jgi:tRNA threonylcarbamoyl adenosine modification protein (Sua5/YciO/YrdC/YwlC family)
LITEFLSIHPDNPQPRLIRVVAQTLRQGGVIVYPTDSCYALGCHIGNKEAMERIRHLRRLDDRHAFALVCRDLSEIALYAKVENWAYRLLKTLTPGPYTFLLKATHEVPRRLQTPKRKMIGIRVPDHALVRALLTEIDEALMSSTLILPGEELPMADPDEMRSRLNGLVDLVIDGGFCGLTPTTVVDLSSGEPVVLRQGKGAVNWLQTSSIL